MNYYHSEIETTRKVAKCLGLDLVESEIDGYDCYALSTLGNQKDIVFGPVHEENLVFLDDIVDHLLDAIEVMDPDELNPDFIHAALSHDEYRNWRIIEILVGIIDLGNELDSSDFQEELLEKSREEIIDNLKEILLEVLE